jgi:hypothetical protein
MGTGDQRYRAPGKRDNDHTAVSLSNHSRRNELREDERAADIDVQHPAPFLERGLQQSRTLAIRTARRNARIRPPKTKIPVQYPAAMPFLFDRCKRLL